MKKITKILILLFTLCAIFLAFIPTIVSTQSGQKQFFRFLSILTRSKIEADSMSLNWFGSQKLHNFHIKTASSDIYFDTINIDSSLIYPLFHKGKFHKIEVINPEGVIKFTQEKSQAIGLPFEQLSLLSGNIQLQTSEKNYKFQNISLDLNLIQQIQVKSSGNLALGLEKGSFSIALDYQAGQINLLMLKTDNFSLAWIDEILKESNHKEFVLSEIGSSITGDLIFDRKNKIAKANLKTPITQLSLTDDPEKQLQITSNGLKGFKKIESTQLLLNFDTILDSTAKIQVLIQNLQLDHLFVEKATSQLNLSGKDGFNFQGDVLLNDPYVAGGFTFQGYMKDLFQELSLQIVSPKLFFASPFFEKKQPLTNLEASFTYRDFHWQAFIEAQNILDLIQPIPFKIHLQTDNISSFYSVPSQIALNIQSAVLNTNTKLSIDPIISLGESAYFKADIPKELFNRFAPKLLADQTLNINGMVEKGGSLEKLEGHMNVQTLQFSGKEKLHELKVDAVEFTLKPLLGLGSLEINGTLDQKAFTVDLNKDLQEEAIEVKATLLPTEPLILLFPELIPIEPLLNPTLSGFGNITRKKGKTFLETHWNSGDFLLKFFGTLDQEKLFLTKPAKCNFRYHLKNDNRLFNENDFYLVSSPLFQLEIAEFSFPLKRTFEEFFTSGKFAIDDIKLFSDRNVTKIERIEGSFKKKLNQSLFADFSTASSLGKFQGQLQADAVDLLKQSNLISSFKGALKLDAIDVPVSFFRLLLSPFHLGQYAKVFGEKIGGTLLYQTHAEDAMVSLNVTSEDCRFQMTGRVEQSILSLTSPIALEIKPNDAFKDLLFEKAQIHLIDTVNPITFYVPSKGFSLSLKDIDPTSLKMPYFVLDFGKVNVKNDGSMEMISQFFRRTFSSTTRLWFAPLEGSYRSGIMQIGRTEILISPNIPVAIWGKLDFNKRKVEMTLGLTAASLQNTLGITNLPSNFVLTVPVRGSFDKIQIDKAQALTKIAALIASGQRFSGQLGNILDFMNQMMNDQGTIPKPKRPFPWEKPLTYEEVPHNKNFHVKLKNHQGLEDIASYSLSVDPIFSLIENQIDMLLKKPAENPEADVLDNL